MKWVFFWLWLPCFLFASFDKNPEWNTEDQQIFWESAEIGTPVEQEEEEDLDRPFDATFTIDLPLEELLLLPPGEVLLCKANLCGLKVDMAVACSFFHKLHPSSDEREAGKADLARHFSDLLPPSGKTLGLITYQNGIKTPIDRFLKSCRAIVQKVPEGTLFIGLHNKTKGMVRDLLRVLREVAWMDTPAVSKSRHFIKEIVSRIHAANPDVLWGSVLHSEAGAIARRAIEGMDPSFRALLKEHLYLFAMSPVLPLPANYGYFSLNLYSRHDFLSIGGYLFGIGGHNLANLLFKAQNCHLFFIPSCAKWSERSFLFFDHSFLGETYLHAMEDQIQRWRKRYGFYDGS